MTDIRAGDEVRVQFDSDARDSKTARVRQVPPFSDTVAGETVEYTDEVEVEYEGTGRGGLLGNLREKVPVANVERVDR